LRRRFFGLGLGHFIFIFIFISQVAPRAFFFLERRPCLFLPFLCMHPQKYGRTERAPSDDSPWLCECVCRSGLKLGVGEKKIRRFFILLPNARWLHVRLPSFSWEKNEVTWVDVELSIREHAPFLAKCGCL
jgi:hypothetical protein